MENQNRELNEEYHRLRQENQYLKQLLTKMMHGQTVVKSDGIVTNKSTPEVKIRLFQSLFKGRTDTYALRWEATDGRRGYAPACAIEWQKPLSETGNSLQSMPKSKVTTSYRAGFI